MYLEMILNSIPLNSKIHWALSSKKKSSKDFVIKIRQKNSSKKSQKIHHKYGEQKPLKKTKKSLEGGKRTKGTNN
jgi:hypothetical protein